MLVHGQPSSVALREDDRFALVHRGGYAVQLKPSFDIMAEDADAVEYLDPSVRRDAGVHRNPLCLSHRSQRDSYAARDSRRSTVV